MNNPIGFRLNDEGPNEETEKEYRHDLVDTQNEAVNHPSHYTYGSIETIDMIESCGWLPHFCAGNALKYLTRHEHKGKKIEDLEKADWYISKLIEYYKKPDKKEEISEELGPGWKAVSDETIKESGDEDETPEQSCFKKLKEFLNVTFNDYYNYTSNYIKKYNNSIYTGTTTSLIKFDHDCPEVNIDEQVERLFNKFILKEGHNIDWENSSVINIDGFYLLHIHIKYLASSIDNYFIEDDIIITPKDNDIIHPELIKTEEKETK